MSEQDASDADLIGRHLAGEGRAFDEIVSRHRNRVYAIAFRICNRHEDALDVTQDVFVTAYRKLSSFRQEAQLTTWLHRLAVNAALDLARKRSRRDHRSLEAAEQLADDAPGPDEYAAASVRAAEVQRALARLSPDHRAVVVLHDLHDLDYAEVAAALGIPVGTVKSRLHRARLELARSLKHLEPIEGEPPSKVEKP
ncbi:MAG: RNA polymerase sigma factor [Actinomycetota bacterium]|nr:sigma-70 family RNA polymerase sigma factor [Actinomycetota bacterium]